MFEHQCRGVEPHEHPDPRESQPRRDAGPALALGAKFACPACRSLQAGEEASKPDPATADFFEARVRPVLAAHCWECHGPQKQKSGLRLDSREAVLRGGETGPAVTAGQGRREPAGRGDRLLRLDPDAAAGKARTGGDRRADRLGEAGSGLARVAPGPLRREARSLVVLVAAIRDHGEGQGLLVVPADPEAAASGGPDAGWAQSTIDRFILARLEAAGLRRRRRPTGERCSAA